MEIGEVHVRTRVQLRDNIGRFKKILDAAAIATAKDLTDKAVELAKANAPVKTGRLRASIEPNYAGKVGHVDVGVPYAHPVEKGSIPHAIPGGFGRDGAVMHPGNAAQPYLEPVERQLAPLAPGIAARHYP